MGIHWPHNVGSSNGINMRYNRAAPKSILKKSGSTPTKASVSAGGAPAAILAVHPPPEAPLYSAAVQAAPPEVHAAVPARNALPKLKAPPSTASLAADAAAREHRPSHEGERVGGAPLEEAESSVTAKKLASILSFLDDVEQQVGGAGCEGASRNCETRREDILYGFRLGYMYGFKNGVDLWESN